MTSLRRLDSQTDVCESTRVLKLFDLESGNFQHGSDVWYSVLNVDVGGFAAGVEDPARRLGACIC